MSKELAKTYDPKGIEERLYTKWMDNGYFHAKVNPDKKPFTIVMPPPNVTGQLHMGHALDETMQDILIRCHAMIGNHFMPFKSQFFIIKLSGCLNLAIGTILKLH